MTEEKFWAENEIDWTGCVSTFTLSGYGRTLTLKGCGVSSLIRSGRAFALTWCECLYSC